MGTGGYQGDKTPTIDFFDPPPLENVRKLIFLLLNKSREVAFFLFFLFYPPSGEKNLPMIDQQCMEAPKNTFCCRTRWL